MAKVGLAKEAKARPIIFGAESVRAILDGRKTQTRRVVKPHPWVARDIGDLDVPYMLAHCPYGIGLLRDRLWVREVWGDVTLAFQSHECEQPQVWAYRADEAVHNSGGFLEHMQDSGIACQRWRTPLFMPRWMSRITLELTDVRVERLQDITGNDAREEGVCDPEDKTPRTGLYRIDQYREAWDGLNAKRGFGWDVNPWVFVLSFKHLKP